MTNFTHKGLRRVEQRIATSCLRFAIVTLHDVPLGEEFAGGAENLNTPVSDVYYVNISLSVYFYP